MENGIIITIRQWTFVAARDIVVERGSVVGARGIPVAVG